MVFRNSTWSGLIGKGTDIKKTGVYDIIASQLTPDAIYDFSTVTFTPGGAANRIGPTLAQVISGISGNNNWKNNSEYLSTRGVQGGIIRWLVPADATYRIITVGGSGGYGQNNAYLPGYGATVQGDFSLLKNTMLNIVVGHRGQDDTWGWGGGGGGGSFVWVENAALPLIVAGGGGGGGSGSSGAENGGSAGQGGGNGQGGGALGGTSGYPGGYNSNVCGGGNGQGWYGGSTYSCGGNFTWPQLTNDPTGLSSYISGPNGGFGGGAHSYGGAGGGGGFSGGGSGGWYPAGKGGGGGNYNTGTNTSSSVNFAAGFVTGSVTITRI